MSSASSILVFPLHMQGSGVHEKDTEKPASQDSQHLWFLHCGTIVRGHELLARYGKCGMELRRWTAAKQPTLSLDFSPFGSRGFGQLGTLAMKKDQRVKEITSMRV